MVSPFLRHLFIALQSSENSDIPKVGFTHSGVNMSARIKNLLECARNYAGMSTGEIIYSLILLNRLVEAELKLIKEGNPDSIVEDNLGTLLLCALLISNKLNRDRPFGNNWWSKYFSVPVDMINQSERVFLQKVGYHLHVNEEEYWEWFRFIVYFDKVNKAPR